MVQKLYTANTHTHTHNGNEIKKNEETRTKGMGEIYGGDLYLNSFSCLLSPTEKNFFRNVI